jgi:hypothetical protein
VSQLEVFVLIKVGPVGIASKVRTCLCRKKHTLLPKCKKAPRHVLVLRELHTNTPLGKDGKKTAEHHTNNIWLVLGLVETRRDKVSMIGNKGSSYTVQSTTYLGNLIGRHVGYILRPVFNLAEPVGKDK